MKQLKKMSNHVKQIVSHLQKQLSGWSLLETILSMVIGVLIIKLLYSTYNNLHKYTTELTNNYNKFISQHLSDASIL